VGVTAVFVIFLVVASIVSIYNEGAFFIPGLAPIGYAKKENIPLYVNKVTSIHSPIPFRYHSLPVCQPSQMVARHENLGELLTGNSIEVSSYQVSALEKVDCKALCQRTLTADNVRQLRELIKQNYVAQWQIDGLPAAMKGQSVKTGEDVYETGFNLGSTQGPNNVFLNNHVKMKIYYHKHTFTAGSEPADKADRFNLVMFEVHPMSIAYSKADAPPAGTWKTTCTNALSGKQQQPTALVEGSQPEVLFTYSIEWENDLKTDWAHRWHKYLSLQGEGQIHWFSIINSIMIVFFLSGMVAMILARTIRRDFAQYLEEDKDEVEETGWKLVHADVFRPPESKSLFAVLIGSGVQVFWMSVVTMAFAVLGFLAPSNQGAITTAVLVLYVWMGVAAGYTSSRVYQMFGGEYHTRNTLLTAFFFPGTLFGIAFFLNFFLWAKGSSGAFHFTTMLAVVALWFCISVPLCFLGSRLAYRRPPPTHPGKVTQIPRQIPEQKWYMHPVFCTLMGGILPFGAVFIELFFIMSSIWLHSYYVLFGFLFLVFLILVITCAEIAIVMCYFQLCSEDWHWWWRSYLTSGASAIYMLLYSIFYFATRLKVQGFVPSLLYFGYSLILCLFFFVLTGTIGFYACLWFVKKIYGAIHQD